MLPSNFGQLEQLDWSQRYTSSALDGNPLIHPPLEICRMGAQAIDRYLKAIASDRGRDKDQEGGGQGLEKQGGSGDSDDGGVKEDRRTLAVV